MNPFIQSLNNYVGLIAVLAIIVPIIFTVLFTFYLRHCDKKEKIRDLQSEEEALKGADRNGHSENTIRSKYIRNRLKKYNA